MAIPERGGPLRRARRPRRTAHAPAAMGELAALATAFCWVGSALFFADASARVGSLPVNLLRLFVGFGFLVVLTTITRGAPLPLDASRHAWIWLSVSGLVGFTFGDLCLFRAFVDLGPRLSTLVMSLAPPIAALVGYAFLGERLTGFDLVAMGLTLGGVAIAVVARPKITTPMPNRGRGLVLALLGSIGQGVGLVLSKHGMGDYDAFASTQIRVLAGAAGFGVVFSLFRVWPRVFRATHDRVAMRSMTLGAIAGPFLGVSLSLLAVRHTETGVAAAIMATTPVLILPFAVFVKRESVPLGGYLGAVIAIAGVALLMAR
ncbi:MAG: DMT family transporter [Sandaracinus sp.]|nr:DMT family transporter [Sandaracinus sp.]MCB9612700.1 DMT family transporter [Sandaracinus sp.]MCB9637101.1 DMT family transporter [Sandaracinus sp.]